MTAVMEDTDLSWVTFTAENQARQCRWGDKTGHERCPREALYTAIFKVTCVHAFERLDLCMAHKNDLLAICADKALKFSCQHCCSPITLSRIEHLR